MIRALQVKGVIYYKILPFYFVAFILVSCKMSSPLSETTKPATMADEKNISTVSESQLSRSDDEGQEITWTEAEEKALVRRHVLH